MGGGLAGLTAALHLSQNNISVSLFEKDPYPRHRVCGEYISNEIMPYLNELGVNLQAENPVLIDRLRFSNKSGKEICSPLKMGGLGISRYRLDYLLYQKAIESGCEVQHATITHVELKNDLFNISTEEEQFEDFDIVLGAFGKRSILDKNLNRKFFHENSGWLGVKAHYHNLDFPDNEVQLHNFNGGYCGLSKTETGAINACYLTSFKSFKKYRNTQDFKRSVLQVNPKLDAFFQNSEMIFDKELTIAQINFSKKSLVEAHILMVGDAAGLIHPLCGNGMAMAIHSAKIASEEILEFYKFDLSREELEHNFQKKWKMAFSSRMRYGRILQKLLLNDRLTSMSLNTLSAFPGMLPKIIKKTHGHYVQ
nr:NAD(P)/FAD-dependent oxidoreductase [Gramella sp. AN32]